MLGLLAASSCSEPIYDAFLARLIEATQSLKLGPAEDPGCPVGPVIDADAQQRILAAHREGRRRKPASRIAGDLGSLRERGLLRRAAHLRRRAADVAAWRRKKSSAPCWRCMKAKNLDDALRDRQRHALRADRRHLLAQPRPTSRRVKREFRVGNLYINRKITGRPGRPPAVRRLQAVGHRLQGGRAGLSVAVRAAAVHHRKHDAARLRAGSGVMD